MGKQENTLSIDSSTGGWKTPTICRRPRQDAEGKNSDCWPERESTLEERKMRSRKNKMVALSMNQGEGQKGKGKGK